MTSKPTLANLKASIARQVTGFAVEKPVHNNKEYLMQPHIAKAHAEAVIERINHLCTSIALVGEIRRGVANVRSAAYVVEPRDPADYHARLDFLYLQGLFTRVEDNKQQPIWTETHRALTYNNTRIDLHVCDMNNRGYLLWLHTEPMSNVAYVKAMLHKRPQIVVQGDYIYHAGKLLRIPTEELFYRLIGIDYIPPTVRSKETYERYARNRKSDPIDVTKLYAPRPTLPGTPDMFAGGA